MLRAARGRDHHAPGEFAPDIDELCGLEPVIELDGYSSGGPTEFIEVQCPYCGESFETEADLSAGTIRQIEDCQVCCQPIELAREVDEAGRLTGLDVSRAR